MEGFFMSKKPKNIRQKPPALPGSSEQQPSMQSISCAELRAKYDLPDDGGYLIISPVPRNRDKAEDR
jgi:hypothetical protein